MAHTIAETVDTLNELLRGELSATETYEQALEKLQGTKGATELRRIHDEHTEAATELRRHIQKSGGEPETSSGVWGAFAKVVEGTAKLFGDDATLKALKEGEEHGAKEYEAALHSGLPTECVTLIESTLLPQTREHISELDRLMAGLVDRITPQEAMRDLNSNTGAMLVCAYDSEEKFKKNHLRSAISLEEFKSRVQSIPKDRELIFYCA